MATRELVWILVAMKEFSHESTADDLRMNQRLMSGAAQARLYSYIATAYIFFRRPGPLL
jgi:hypothetical protein